jgi:hypothetical protein
VLDVLGGLVGGDRAGRGPAWFSGFPDCPAGSVVAGAEDGEPGPVDGADTGVEAGADAGQPAGACFAAAPRPGGFKWEIFRSTMGRSAR